MSNLHFPESELILNADGSIFHLHLRPEQIADKIILVGDPGRAKLKAVSFVPLRALTKGSAFL